MEYAHLGRSGVLVSRIGLGTMNFGDATGEPEAFQIMDRAVELGVNFFDSADVYGGPQRPDMEKGFGTSEEIIGRWLQRSGKRDDIVLATKAYQPMGLGPNDRRLSAYHLKRACEASLRRLQTDHIDLYQMHHVDRATPFEEIWQAMQQLVVEGKITYIGSSNFAGWDIATAQLTAQHRNFLGLVSEQSLYNLTNRAIEQELIPALQHFDIGLIPWSPLASGVLAGKPKGEQTVRRAALSATYDALAPQLDAYEQLCATRGRTPAEVAQAWLLHQPAVASVIAGSRTVAQLDAAVDALTVQLDETTLAELDRVWPGPGIAPQSYAW
ncbi:aldo/keto reductase [Mycobacterium sp. DBP42]|uniref:aldo/keto reductase n=1 Tax=Mycobacterium sp. DBP42 TaxID=2545267 RepID=UPI00110C9C19|nr:aldo/keto reductase [Mycobacterium sp. DBP42]TMS51142.1 aldo/keto reductase [Mycobacterium sp. DBP42]